MRVACAQLSLVVGTDTRARTERAVRDAAAAGAELVVLPELASSGYAFEDRGEAARHAEPLDGPTVAAWTALAADLDLGIVGGLCERGEGGDLYNSAVVIDADGVRGAYRKVHLWDREKGIFTPGEAAPPVVEFRGHRISVIVCYDLEFPEWVRGPALSRVRLLCAPVAWPRYPRPEGERPAEVLRVQTGAGMNRMFVAAADRVGRERNIEWTGGSVIVDADGWPLAGPHPDGEEHLLVADCDLASADDKAISDNNDVMADRRPTLYGAVVEEVSR